MKNYLYPLFLATALTTVACSDDEKVTDFIEEETPLGQKESIAFTVSDLGASQQGAQTRAGFTATTQIVARFESFKSSTVGVAPGAGADKRSTRTVLVAGIHTGTALTDYSEVNYATVAEGNDPYIRYWDDAFGRFANISVYAVAVPQKTGATNGVGENEKTLVDLVSYGGSVVSTSNSIWKKEDAENSQFSNNNINWVVNTTAQTSGTDGTIAAEDLCYSNNIQDDKNPGDADNVLGKDGRYVWNFESSATDKYEPAKTGATTHKDGPLRIALKESSDPTSSGRFDKGHLVFKHALTRITITLKQSSSDFSGDFKFASGTNIKLLKMPVSGTLNIKEGTWTVPNDTDHKKDIAKIAPISGGSTAAGTYQAQVLPGYVLTDGDKTNVFEFTIDNNTYYITQDNLFDALTYVDPSGDTSKNGSMSDFTGSAITMEQGKHYKFTIVLNKAKIENITATLADWVVVEAAEESMDNSHVEFTFLNPMGTNCTEINFYRLAEDLGKIYTDKSYITDGKGIKFSGNYGSPATLTAMTGDDAGKYSTNWYYDNNQTAYHFRTVNNNGKTTLTTPSSDPKNTCFTMTADATTKDYHWGAPMKTDATLAYNPETGFTANLHEGITSTWSDIKITELHMMSNLEIVLKTSTGDDKVDLSGATIKITNLATSATVDMGTGLITPAAVATNAEQATTAPGSDNYWKTANVETKPFTCAVIPQSLTRGTGTDTQYVGLTITTSDANQYYVIAKLSEILASSVSPDERNQEKDEPITRWYPNHTYKYTFKITKKGIENITCTVAEWVTVVGADTEIDLES